MDTDDPAYLGSRCHTAKFNMQKLLTKIKFSEASEFQSTKNSRDKHSLKIKNTNTCNVPVLE